MNSLAQRNVETIDEFDGGPSLVFRYEQQRMPSNIRVSIDSDFAPDRGTRKSTSGMVQRLGFGRLVM